MNDKIITSYIEKHFKKIKVRKTILKSLLFFIKCALKCGSLVPAKAGKETETSQMRHGIKRIHRFLKNKLLSNDLMCDIYLKITAILLHNQNEIILAMDWTIIRDKFCFLSISWVNGEGQSTPLYFTGYEKLCLDEKSQTDIEHTVLKKVAKTLGNRANIMILADRGFDAPSTLLLIERLGWQYIIRVKSKKTIVTKSGIIKKTHQFVKKPGCKKKLESVIYTKTRKVCCHFYINWQTDAKESWMLLSNINDSIERICFLYSLRWEIEEMFKAMKNEDVGFDIRKVRLSKLDRWLRLLFVGTLLFQALGQLGTRLRQVDKLEKRYSMSSKPPKKQRHIFSIFNLAFHVLKDRAISLKYSIYKGFSIKLPGYDWILL